MDALLETLCQENHFETILGPFLTLSDYPVYLFRSKNLPTILISIIPTIFHEKIWDFPRLFKPHCSFRTREKSDAIFPNIFFKLQCKLQCNVSTCFFFILWSSCYYIKVRYYTKCVHIFVISGCLYLLKAASTHLKKKIIITKNKIACLEELSTYYNEKLKCIS